MANKTATESGVKKAKPAKRNDHDADDRRKSGPNMMPHTGKKDCRCPSCKEKGK